MPTVPDNIIGKIQWYQNHQAPWGANTAAIGLVPGDLAPLEAKTTAAADALAAQQAAQDAAKAATVTLRTAIADLTDYGSDLLKKIKAKAAVDGDNVYALAQIPPPSAPSPVPAPGTPNGFKAGLLPDGSIEISFKCVNPSGSQGTVYEIARQLGASGAFETIATVGKKTFVDDTLVRGTEQATYGITAIRSTRRGVAGMFTVYFGVGASGEMVATIGPSEAKMAA